MQSVLAKCSFIEVSRCQTKLYSTAHTPTLAVGRRRGVPAKRRQKRFAHSTASRITERRKRKVRIYLGSAGESEARYREKEVNWGR